LVFEESLRWLLLHFKLRTLLYTGRGLDKLLRIRELSKTYNGIDYAIRNLSFSVEKGHIVSLLGHNGAGKSTTLRIIASILAPSSGDVEINHISLSKATTSELREIKRSIGYLNEYCIPFEHLTATEYLFYVGKLYGIENNQELMNTIRNLESTWGIDLPEEKFISEYSSGLVKRIAIASVLLNKPSLLLLDEPLNNLDPIGVKLFKEHLQYLRKGGTRILIATHNLDFAEKYSDDIVIIEEGQKIFQGSISSLIKHIHPEEGKVSLEELYSLLSTK
jgi:ABC-2 type transport system ATP-binding protein